MLTTLFVLRDAARVTRLYHLLVVHDNYGHGSRRRLGRDLQTAPAATVAIRHRPPLRRRLVTDWKQDFGLLETLVKGGLCMSGMYDLKPVRLSARSKYANFTDEIEQAMSPQRQLDLLRAPVIVTFGTNETPEFQRQSRDFAAAVKAAGKPVELIVAENYNHFETEESLGNPYGPNGRAALALMKLAPA